jgi:hypothetical protein
MDDRGRKSLKVQTESGLIQIAEGAERISTDCEMAFGEDTQLLATD